MIIQFISIQLKLIYFLTQNPEGQLQNSQNYIQYGQVTLEEKK
jgi:hypothetical protein